MLDLKSLPFPNVIEKLSYEEILATIKHLFIRCLDDDEIGLLESDSYSALLECLAYRELLLRTRINNSVSSMLLPFASGSDLDNVVSIYGIERLKGVKPRAKIEFNLSMSLNSDILVPKGVIISSQNGEIATLKDDLLIKKGEIKTSGIIVLDKFIQTSDIKCEYIQTPLPFVLKAKQISSFKGGANKESDERLRQRAILSLERFSTAGAKKAYIYQTLSASSKVLECQVQNGGAGIVNVFIKTIDMSEETRKDVEEYLSGEKVRPLTDNVFVFNATKKDVIIKAELELIDMFMGEEINKNLQNINKSLHLGEDLNISYIYKTLHQSGVYRAILKEPLNDIKADISEFINFDFKISFKRAQL